MLLRGMTVDAYIIINGDNTGEMVHCLVHAYLKDVLRHLQADGHVQEPVPATVSVECG